VSDAPPGEAAPSGARAPGAERWIGTALSLAALVLFPILLSRGWAKWNDLFVDFGRELSVPWRLTEGEVLYRDLAYFNGPLSPYLNALWFQLGGVGLHTLLVANVAVTLAAGVLSWLVLRCVGGVVAAGLGVLFFLPVFACGHFPGIGNYNFLSPYSHELTHGLVLALAALLAALGWRSHRSSKRLILAGSLLGLAFLTKPEVFAAAAAGVWVTVLGALWTGRASAREWLGKLALLHAPIALLFAVATALFSSAMPFGVALEGALGGWTGIVGSEVAELPFYQRSMGLDRPAENAGLMLRSFGWLAALVGPALALELAVRKQRALVGAVLGLAAAATSAIVLLALAPDLALLDDPQRSGLAFRRIFTYWLGFSRHVPMTGTLAVLSALVLGLRAREPEARLRWFRRGGFAALATALCAKIALNTSFAHYGFALAALGALLAVLVVSEWLPRAVAGHGGAGWVLRGALAGALIAAGTFAWQLSEHSFARKTFALGEGPDRFWTDQRGPGVAHTLATLDERLEPDASLLVLPEGIMLNYLARRRTPTRHINFMPPELILFGEETILSELQASPPDAVLLVHKDTTEYGFPFFGRDYGRAIMSWLESRHRDGTILAGQPPLRPGTYFGIGLLE